MSRKASFRPRSVEIDILSIGARGDGVGQWEGEQVFVPLTVAGDRVAAKLEGRRGEGLFASLIAVLQPGPHRAIAPCALFGRCGGCSLQHLSDPALALWKRERVVTALGRIGVAADLIRPTLSIAPGTRRRASFTFNRLRHSTVLGFNERASHRLLDVDPCLLLEPALLGLLPPLRELLTDCLTVGGSGDAVATVTECGIDLVIQTERKLDLFLREKLASFAERQDLARVSWLRGTDVEPVAHRRPVRLQMGGVPVAIPPGGFLQPSRAGEAALVRLVVESLPPSGAIADLYAGCGSFTFPIAQAGHPVHAVEGDAAAIAALVEAAHHSGRPVTGEQRDLARQPLLAAELKKYAAILFDPPRAGAAAQAEQLAMHGPAVVIAVSCNPATLARDAALLLAGGYRLSGATPVDQFPWSAHVEVVARFQRF